MIFLIWKIYHAVYNIKPICNWFKKKYLTERSFFLYQMCSNIKFQNFRFCIFTGNTPNVRTKRYYGKPIGGDHHLQQSTNHPASRQSHSEDLCKYQCIRCFHL